MNWLAFLAVIAAGTSILCLAVSMSYWDKLDPEHHKTMRTVAYGLFTFSVILWATIAGLGAR